MLQFSTRNCKVVQTLPCLPPSMYTHMKVPHPTTDDVLVMCHAYHLKERVVCYALQQRSEQHRQLQRIPLKHCGFNDNIHVQPANASQIRFGHNGHRAGKSLWIYSDFLLRGYVVLKVPHT